MTDTTGKEIIIEGVDTRELYGAKECYLQQIVAMHPKLKIVVRGSSLKVLVEIYGKYQEGSRILFIDNSSPYRCALIFQTNLTTLQTTNGVTKMFSIGDRSSYNNKMGLSVEYNASYKCNGAVFNGVNRPLIDDSNSWVIPYHNCFSLGARMDWITNVFAGEFFNIRIYNRALTGAEIAHNYAVDKERFGL